ncbi:MAG: insulinase family protein [Treponema sp.]|nr:insulinase family protein [Treponema sp.]
MNINQQNFGQQNFCQKNFGIAKFYLQKFLFLFALIPALFACQTAGKAVYGDLGSAKDPVPFMKNARTGVLPSGLRYYILENSMPAGRAYLTLAVDAGSVLETEDERGLAHFVEHMAFNGTERFPQADLINYLRSLGMRFGPEINAYTSYDETVYGIEVPVETADGVRRIPDTALDVIDDWTRAITFDAKAVDDERNVIMEEYRTRLGAGERMRNQMLPVLFEGSPYAERLPIGLPEVIENAPAQRLKDFYSKWYRPDNMAVILVGDFDGAFLESSLEQHFKIQPAKEPLNRPRYTLPEPKKGSVKTLVQTDPEYTQARIDLYFKRKAELPSVTLGGYRSDLIAYLADTIINMRFDEAASSPQTPYMRAGAGTVRYGYGSRYYILTAQSKTGLSAQTLNELLLLKESLVRYGFTDSEADMAKRSLVSSMEQMTAEKDRQDSDYFINVFTSNFIDGETVPDIDWELDTIKQLLPGISLKEINAAVKNYFADDDLTVFISAPESDKNSLPTDVDIRALALSVKRAPVAPPVSAVINGELLDKVPAPGIIVSESADMETGALRWTLGNGMEVIIKGTANKNNEISFYALARGGTASVLPDVNAAPDAAAAPDSSVWNKFISASLSSEMMNASGLGPFTRPELVKKLADKQVGFSFWESAFLRGFQGSAATGDLKVLMEMIYLGFTQPRLDSDAVTALLDQMRTRLSVQNEDPDQYFSNQMTRTVYGNPVFYPLEAGDIDRVSISDAMDFIRLCLNPADYTFVFTGNIDAAAIRPLVETYLASLPQQPKPFNEWANADYMRPANVQKEIYKGKEERSSVVMTWFTPMQFSDRALAASSALNEYLNIVLNDEIRENLGGVYSISAWVSLSPVPSGELSGGFYFICNPDRAVELSGAALAVVRSVADGTIDADVLEKAKQALVKDQEQSVQSNLYIAQSYANSAVIYNSPLSRLDKRPALYQAVTANDLQYIADSLLDGGTARLILYPEGNSGQ